MFRAAGCPLLFFLMNFLKLSHDDTVCCWISCSGRWHRGSLLIFFIFVLCSLDGGAKHNVVTSCTFFFLVDLLKWRLDDTAHGWIGSSMDLSLLLLLLLFFIAAAAASVLPLMNVFKSSHVLDGLKLLPLYKGY